ncbi:hypothetical protein PEL8287_02810 [Roseovarius litorisediminis]|uniref:Uncharacterized protein n=1 Tax=Roseovarius litorisediminis TaxID=1312363 RepID=A0A1Y5T062_9RHOB|nr:hypothetical protein [Roseovarius litorisediminis]SLN52856.1 hypothetical protein PEL8287_02810 [Roseovarius litorisediminis]
MPLPSHARTADRGALHGVLPRVQPIPTCLTAPEPEDIPCANI